MVGVPDERTGERACAVIVPGVERRPRSAAAPRDFLGGRRRVAKLKAPGTGGAILDTLPKNDAGKVLKHQIKAELHRTTERQVDMQVAIVTGASSGIGFGWRKSWPGVGMAVLGTGRDRGAGDAELEKAIGDPDRVATVAVDLTADDAPKRIVDLALESGVGSIFSSTTPASAAPSRCTRPTTNTRLFPQRHAARAVPAGARGLAHMKPGSAIINVTSTFAVIGGLRGGAYSAAKGGLTALTGHIACQYGRRASAATMWRQASP